MVATLRSLPFLWVDALTADLPLIPFFYFVGLAWALAFFKGTRGLYLDTPPSLLPTSSLYDRQWLWERCRSSRRPLRDFERIFYRRLSF